MPLVLLILAVGMIAIGARGQASAAGALLQSEFTGSNSFLPWFLAIMLLGVIGYWKPARPFSGAFIALVLLVIFLKDGTGFFAQLQSAFMNAKPNPSNPVAPVGGSPAAQAQTANVSPQNLVPPPPPGSVIQQSPATAGNLLLPPEMMNFGFAAGGAVF